MTPQGCFTSVPGTVAGAPPLWRFHFSTGMARATLGESGPMKREASFFDGKEPVLIYIARKLNDALRLEAILDSAGVDYGVEADQYRGGGIFRPGQGGAFFFVLPGNLEGGPPPPPPPAVLSFRGGSPLPQGLQPQVYPPAAAQ